METKELLISTTPTEKELIRMVLDRASKQKRKENKEYKKLVNDRVKRITPYITQQERKGDNIKLPSYSHKRGAI